MSLLSLYLLCMIFLTSKQSSLSLSPGTFSPGPLDELKSSLNGTDFRLLHSVLLSYYRILRATPSLPEELGWDLLPLYELFNTPHPDQGVVWLAIRCYALQAGTSEARREAIENEILGERGEEDCDVYYGEDVAGVSQVADGWVLPVLEAQRVQQYRDRLLQCDDYFSEDTVSDISLQASDLRFVSPPISHGSIYLIDSV